MDEPRRCVILGGGGHAGVLIDALLTAGAAMPCAVVDADPSLWGSRLLDVPIVGGDDRLGEIMTQGVEWFLVGLGSTGDNRPRQRLFELGLSHGLRALVLTHPGAHCSRWVTVSPGAQVLVGAIVNTGTVLGANVIVNSGAVIEHDCLVGDHAHVATGARLGGAVRVGAGAFVGAGSTIRQGIAIGARALVGAGAVVVEDVPQEAVVVGVPARALRSVAP